MKRFRVSSLISAILACILLSGCVRTVRSPADELSMYQWGTQTENGNRLALSFDENTATFRAENDSYTLVLSGIYTINDAELIINDSDTHLDYCFSYILHGNGVELTYGGGTVLLDKK